ncbi:MAG: hypothetical protein LIO46_04505 [Clostridiales bacterium]|nr:hypothetical protein [Clostridiales bacterium]
MKHLKRIHSLLLALLLLLPAAGCAKGPPAVFSESPVLCVVETGPDNSSYLRFLDGEFQELGRKHIPKGHVVPGFDRVYYREGEIFAAVRGNFAEYEEEIILRYHISDGTYEELDMGLWAMNNMALYEDYVFGTNAVNFIGTITNRHLVTGQVQTLEVGSDAYVDRMQVMYGMLYAVVHYTQEEQVYLYEIEIDTLDVIRRHNITEFGAPEHIIEHGNSIYLANQLVNVRFGPDATNLTVYQPADQSFRTIELGTASPYLMQIQDGTLFITHYNPVLLEGNQVTVLDLETEEFVTHDFPHAVDEFQIDGETVYILDNDRTFYKYRYRDGAFTLLLEYVLPPVDADDPEDTYYYIPAITLCKDAG